MLFLIFIHLFIQIKSIFFINIFIYPHNSISNIVPYIFKIILKYNFIN